MFYSLYKHRKSVGHQAAQFHENAVVEIVWTVIPFLILLFMALVLLLGLYVPPPLESLLREAAALLEVQR